MSSFHMGNRPRGGEQINQDHVQINSFTRRWYVPLSVRYGGWFSGLGEEVA